jgi:hypothetical protein
VDVVLVTVRQREVQGLDDVFEQGRAAAGTTT